MKTKTAYIFVVECRSLFLHAGIYEGSIRAQTWAQTA